MPRGQRPRPTLTTLVGDVASRWNLEREPIARQLLEFGAWAEEHGARPFWTADQALIETYLASGHAGADPSTLRRFFALAAEAGLIEASPLPRPKPPRSARAEIEALVSDEVRALIELVVQRRPNAKRHIHAALLPYLRWCAQRGINPVAIAPHVFERFLAEVGPDPEQIAYWHPLSYLRAFFDVALAAGLRQTHPFPRRVRLGLTRSAGDPLARLVKRVVRTYGRAAQASVSSDLTAVIERLRRAGEDPLDVGPERFARVIRDERLRRRAWRPLGALLEAAGAKVGTDGQRLRAEIRRASAGGDRRRLIGRWREWARGHGLDPGAAPPVRREQFLSMLAAEDATPADLAAMRSAIRELEREATRSGRRVERSRRVEKLLARLSLLGLDEEHALAVLDRYHAAYKPSVERGLDALLVRWLDWASGNGIDPLRVDDATLAAYRSERGDYLGTTPIRRFSEAVAQVRSRPLDELVAERRAADESQLALRAPA